MARDGCRNGLGADASVIRVADVVPRRSTKLTALRWCGSSTPTTPWRWGWARRLAAALVLGAGWAWSMAGPRGDLTTAGLRGAPAQEALAASEPGAREAQAGVGEPEPPPWWFHEQASGDSRDEARTRATVTNVVDGDTIDVVIVTSTYRVRYIGIDTPERGKPYFHEATEANRRLVTQGVCLERDQSETDTYGRLLRYAYVDDGHCAGTFVNAELIRLGLALLAYYPPDLRHFYLFARLQVEAMRACIGIWVWSPTCSFLPHLEVAVPARQGRSR